MHDIFFKQTFELSYHENCIVYCIDLKENKNYDAYRCTIKYLEEENAIRAVNNGYNSPVYEDSCLAFFISFDDSGYYNFEFN